MSKRLAAGFAALLLTGVLGAGTASAGPTPDETVSCTGSIATLTWAKAKLSSVTFDWLASDKTVVFSQAVPLMPHPPHGSIQAEGMYAPVAVRVTFMHEDGVTSEILDATCS